MRPSESTIMADRPPETPTRRESSERYMDGCSVTGGSTVARTRGGFEESSNRETRDSRPGSSLTE
jgi:hypothetical protein